MGSLLTWKGEEEVKRKEVRRQVFEPPSPRVQEREEEYSRPVRTAAAAVQSKPKIFSQPPETGATNNVKQQVKLESQVLFEKEQQAIKNIEANLLNLQMEKKKLSNEFDKIPDSAKTIAQRRRKGDLEREIKILDKNISSLKGKLRDMQAL